MNNVGKWGECPLQFGRLKLAFALFAAFCAAQNAAAYGAAATLVIRDGTADVNYQGISDNQPTKEAARREALRKCNKAVAGDAKTGRTGICAAAPEIYEDTCFAVILHDGIVHDSRNADLETAKRETCLKAFARTPYLCSPGIISRTGGACDWTCAGEDKIIGNNTCDSCTGDLRANSRNNACVCPDGQILDPSTPATDDCTTPVICVSPMIRNPATNTCKCPDGMRFAGGQTEICVPETCGANEIRNTDETCAACDANATADTSANICECNTGYTGNGMTCAAIICEGDLILNGNNCECPANSARAGAANICVCDNAEHIFDSAGKTCMACGSGMQPATGKRNCEPAPPECDSNAVYNATTEICECNSGYTGNGMTCTADAPAPPECDSNAVYNATTEICECNSGYTGNGIICTADAPTPPECDSNAVYNATTEICECNSGYTGDGMTCTADAPTPPECDSNAAYNATTEICECNFGYTGNGITCTAIPAVDCSEDAHPLGSVPNGDRTDCVCESGMEEFDDFGRGFCAPPMRGQYTMANCIGAGWTAIMVFNGTAAGEICNIPYQIVAALPAGNSPGVSALAAYSGSAGDACLLRRHSGFPAGKLSYCGHENVFGAHGLPPRPAEFGGGHRLTIVADSGPERRKIHWNGAQIRKLVLDGGGGGRGGNRPAQVTGWTTAGGLLILIGSLIYDNIQEGGGFYLTPDYAFSSNGGAAAYSYGSRLDYQNGNYSAYWSAGRRYSGTNAGEWHAAAGAEIARESWKIGYTSRIFGEEIELELSAALSEKTGRFGYSSGIVWNYRADKTDGDFSAFWRNSFAMDYGKWRLISSADFYWRDGGDIWETGIFRIDLLREL